MSMMKEIAIASDHAGLELKEKLKEEISKLGFAPEDLGTHDTQSVDYPDYAEALAAWMKTHKGSKGVLVCGSGIGMSIAANRHTFIRAALVHNGEEATLARKHNDANVLCLGGRLIEADVAKEALKAFVETPFEGGRHEKRVEKLG